MVSIIVLLVCAALVGLGIWLISRPEPLSVIPRPPRSARTATGGEPLVDLDPVKVEWDSSGAIDNVSVFLENVESNSRTRKKTVLADVHNVTFSADELKSAATSRAYHGKNRIRTVIEWPGHIVRSDPVDILVGIKVRLMTGGTLIRPSGTRGINTLLATIDDSTEEMPSGYCFAVDFAGWNRSGALVALLKSCNSDSEVVLPFLSEVNWRRPGLVFNEPLPIAPSSGPVSQGPSFAIKIAEAEETSTSPLGYAFNRDCIVDTLTLIEANFTDGDGSYFLLARPETEDEKCTMRLRSGNRPPIRARA